MIKPRNPTLNLEFEKSFKHSLYHRNLTKYTFLKALILQLKFPHLLPSLPTKQVLMKSLHSLDGRYKPKMPTIILRSKELGKRLYNRLLLKDTIASLEKG